MMSVDTTLQQRELKGPDSASDGGAGASGPRHRLDWNARYRACGWCNRQIEPLRMRREHSGGGVQEMESRRVCSHAEAAIARGLRVVLTIRRC